MLFDDSNIAADPNTDVAPRAYVSLPSISGHYSFFSPPSYLLHAFSSQLAENYTIISV